jgi:integrase
MLDGISAPILANRVHSVVSTFFKWCVENDLISISPAAGIRRPHKEKSRDRVLTDSELGQAWRSANGFYGQIVRLLILTGQRRGEVSGMCWNELDLDQATWTLPPERTKNGRRHEIPLSKQALAIIRGLPRISEHYVFAVDGVRPYRGRQVRAGGTDWVVHDLRRSVATGLQRLGVRLEVTEAVLNHVSGSRGGIVGVYQKHKYTDEKRQALQQWADYVERLVRS